MSMIGDLDRAGGYKFSSIGHRTWEEEAKHTDRLEVLDPTIYTSECID